MSARQGRPSLQVTQQEDAPISDLMASWNDIVSTVAMNSPVPGAVPGGGARRFFDDDVEFRQSYNSDKHTGYSPMGASLSPGDSLEISGADFEIGTIAARRSMEKANTRRLIIPVVDDYLNA